MYNETPAITATTEVCVSMKHDSSYRTGLVLAIAVSLILHCSAFSMVWYYSTQPDSGDTQIVIETVLLGNVGGNPGSIQGKLDPEENTPISSEKEPAEQAVVKGIEHSLVVKRPPEIPMEELTEPLEEEKVEPKKPMLSNVHLKQLALELKKSIPEKLKDLPETSIVLPEVKIPDLLATNRDLLQYGWTETESKIAELVQAIHRKRQMEKDREKEKLAKQEPVRGGKEEAAKEVASEKAPVNKGNAATSGNNRSGIGNIGSGGNNNGETRPASLINELCLAPAYPFEAWRRNQQGAVTVSFRCLTTGSVTDVKVVHSSGSSMLDDAAVEAVQKWKLRPAQIQGVPQSEVFQKEFRFIIQ